MAKYGTFLDLLQNELRNARIQNLASDPGTPVDGQIYFNTGSSQFRGWNGSVWVNLGNTVEGMSYQGGYDASTNTPDLDTSPSSIIKGDSYTVTVAGTFFTTNVEVGDLLIAEIDNATVEADWTIVNRNLGNATEGEAGVTEIATQAEVDSGTDDFRYITPLKLTTWFANTGGTKKFSTTINGNDVATQFTINHNFNTRDVQVAVWETTGTYERIMTDEFATDVNALVPISAIAGKAGEQLLPDGLISGGVFWVSGLQFQSTEIKYSLAGEVFVIQPTTINLNQGPSAPDARIDVFYVDDQGTIGVLEGVPGVTPVKPEVDPLTQIELTFALLGTDAIAPSGITNGAIYLENAGTSIY